MIKYILLFIVYSSILLIGRSYANTYDPSNYFCRELSRQHLVDISQLEGIWYQIEKIIHTEERHKIVHLGTCPVIHIAEDRLIPTTYNPLHVTYGAAYPHGNMQNPRNPTDPKSKFASVHEYMKQLEEYDRKTTYDYERRQKYNNLYRDRYLAYKYIKIYVSDGMSTIEHHLKYNTSNPGFWVISGANEGIQHNLDHFAGTIQILKAVGNHLVLTVCQSARSKELYTMILSRENYLDSSEVHNVHSMLLQQGLRTQFVETTCSGVAGTIGAHFGLALLLGIFSTILCLF